jgi:uncharacterized protein
MSAESEILQKYRVVAVVGLSPNEERASYHVASYLKAHGYMIVPVNPAAAEILGEKCYPELGKVTCEVEVVDVFRRSSEVPAIVDQAIELGAKAVWMQEGIVNEEAAERARRAGLTVVVDKCMLKEHRRLQEEGF